MVRTSYLTDVIEKVERKINDANKLYQSSSSGTLEQYYKQLISETVYDLMVMPIDRHSEPIDLQDTRQIGDTVQKIAALIASVFFVPAKRVEEDFIAEISAFPLQDVRIAKKMKRQGLLN